MFNFVSNLIGAPLSVVELVGKAIQVVGETVDSDILKDAAKTISDNAETIAK